VVNARPSSIECQILASLGRRGEASFREVCKDCDASRKDVRAAITRLDPAHVLGRVGQSDSPQRYRLATLNPQGVAAAVSAELSRLPARWPRWSIAGVVFLVPPADHLRSLIAGERDALLLRAVLLKLAYRGFPAKFDTGPHATIVSIGATPHEPSAHGAPDALARLLHEHGELTLAEIAKELNYDQVVAELLCRRLIEKHVLCRRGGSGSPVRLADQPWASLGDGLLPEYERMLHFGRTGFCVVALDGSVPALRPANVCALAIAAVALVLLPLAALGSPGSQGTLLVVSNRATGGPVRLSLVDVTRGTTRGILQGRDIWPMGAGWSPDGRWIALAKGTDVVLLGGDGHGLRRLPQLRTRPAQAVTFLPVVRVGARLARSRSARPVGIGSSFAESAGARG
jgi:hypothetical protein